MRTLPLLPVALLLAGCGVSAASSPTPTPQATKAVAYHQPGARWTHPPAFTINKNHHYYATVSTSDGTFVIALLPKIAPQTVNNFVFLARHHFYDHNPISRILRSFVIQTGDPTGSGEGGPGYQIPDELSPKLKYTFGTVAMANAGPNTNGSQFFIVVGPLAAKLPAAYSIFGFVIKGQNVLLKLANTPVTQNLATNELSAPLHPVWMKSVTIQETP